MVKLVDLHISSDELLNLIKKINNDCENCKDIIVKSVDTNLADTIYIEAIVSDETIDRDYNSYSLRSK